MLKNIFIVLVILLVGCKALPSGDVIHSWGFVNGEQYDVDNNRFHLNVVYTKKQGYYKFGGHDSVAYEYLDNRLIDVSVQLDSDMNKIQAQAEFKDNPDQTSSDSHSLKSMNQRPKEICANPEGVPLNQLPENQETSHYHLTVCLESLTITNKTSGDQCVIDLDPLNERFSLIESSLGNPLSKYFAYSIQDIDGSVLLWKNNYGNFVGKDSIDIIHTSCDNNTHKRAVGIETLGSRFNLSISHYGTPTIIANYSNEKYKRIMSLSGDVIKDPLELTSRDWKTLFLPDHKYLYDFDFDYEGASKGMKFDIIVTRYDYGNDLTETRRITVNQPTE